MMLAALLAALAMAPQQNPDALSEQGKQLAIARRYEEAAAVWNRALKISPKHFPTLFNFGYMNFTLKKFAEAEQYLARAAAANPRDFNTAYLLGNVRVEQGKREDGLRAWRAAAAIQPAHYKLLQIMAVEYSAGNYFSEACAVAQRALALQSGTPEPYYIAIKACQDAADPVATKLAQQAAAAFPRSARANFEYGFQLQRSGRAAESQPFFRKAMELDPAYEEPFYFYARTLFEEDRYAEAAPYLENALKNRPDYVPACVALAKALIETDRLDAAVRELEKCSALNPAHPQPHLLLSQACFRMGDETRARAEKSLSLKLRREHPEIMEAPQARPFPAP